MADPTSILTEISGRVGIVRLNRPKAINALNSVLLAELSQTLQAWDQQAEIGAMVITGSERVFSVGVDIKEMAEAGPLEIYRSEALRDIAVLQHIQKPVIAAVSGWCLGGGNELALSCDMIVASETAKFAQPEINIGVIPGAGGTQRLTRAVGKAIAMEMILNNRTLSAAEALQFGLVNRVVPQGQTLAEAVILAGEIAARAPLAVQLGKAAVKLAYETFLEEGLAAELRSFSLLFSSQDQKEGMAAFIEKRSPVWKGE